MDGLDKHKKGVGGRIKSLRGDISQSVFAEQLKISLPALQRYEYGERIPKGDVLERISILTGKSVEWILTGEAHLLADRAAEDRTLYHDDLTKKILDMLSGMNKEQKREALRFIEGQKFVAERDKKLKEGA